MGSVKEFQLVGCLGRHGSYSFFRSIKIGGRTLSLTSFFPVRPLPDSAILSIAEVQLLWTDKTEGFCSLKLYFLPENTPEGRRHQHGEDEVIALQDKVIIRALDLSSWLVSDSDWDWGYVTPDCSELKSSVSALTKSFISDKFQKKDRLYDFAEPGSSKVVVMNYERYVRLRSVLKRLEGSSEMSNWLSHPLVLALGNINVGPGCKVLFAKEVFEHPELEDHELLCNHLAPKLKGRPRKKNRKRNPSLGSESNESEASSSGRSSKSTEQPNKFANDVAQAAVVSENLKPDAPEPKSPTVIVTPSISPELKPKIVNSEMNHKHKADGASLPNSNGIQVLKLHPQPVIKNGKIPTKLVENVSSLPPRKKASIIGMNMDVPAASVKKDHNVDDQKVNDIDDKKTTAEILGPALSELAEKLEKSNAIKILPVRSSVITKMESSSEMDISRVSMNKTEKSNPPPPLKSITVSEVRNSQAVPNWTGGDSIKVTRPVRNYPPLTAQNPAHPNPIPTRHPTIKDNRNAFSYYLPPFTSRPTETNDGPEVTITPFDHRDPNEPKYFNNNSLKRKYPPFALTPAAVLPSTFRGPFSSTSRSSGQVYGDPYKSDRNMGRPAIPVLTKRPEPVPMARPNEALDFTWKKPRLEAETKSSHNSNMTNANASSGDFDLLDLSMKSQQKNNFKNISDIPPPNAMNQMGVRLTSEVTLYPAGSRQASASASASNVKFNHTLARSPELSSKKTLSPSNNDSRSQLPNYNDSKTHASRTPGRARSSKEPPNPWNSIVQQQQQLQQQVQLHKEHMQLSRNAVQQRLSNPRVGVASNGLRNTHPQPRFGHPDTKLPNSSQIDRLPQPGHVHGTAAKPVASKGSLRQEENGRESRETEISRPHDIGKLQLTPPQDFSHFLNLQRMDPLYLTLCSRFIHPFSMAPTPDAIEDWQRYQEMMRGWPYTRANDPK